MISLRQQGVYSKTVTRPLNFVRKLSDHQYLQKLESAKTNVSKTLEQYDRSSFILSAYIPEPARNGFLAMKAFNVEISKINAKNSYANLGGISSVDLKFKFWSDYLMKIFKNPFSNQEAISEPSMFLLRDSMRNGINFNLDYFNTYLNNKKYWLSNPDFQNIDGICSFGEGTYSQMIYQEQTMLLSPNISPSVIALLEESKTLQNLVTDIAAHIGQANSIANNLLTMKYYAKQEIVTLPVDVMTEEDLSQDALISYINEVSKIKAFKDSEIEEKLKNIIFKISTRANDHLLTSRYKLEKIKEEISKITKNTNSELILSQSKNWKKGIPDIIFVPFMNSIPVDIFIKNLQKHDFNILNERLSNNSLNRWKVVWKSFYNYNTRNL